MSNVDDMAIKAVIALVVFFLVFGIVSAVTFPYLNAGAYVFGLVAAIFVLAAIFGDIGAYLHWHKRS